MRNAAERQAGKVTRQMRTPVSIPDDSKAEQRLPTNTMGIIIDMSEVIVGNLVTVCLLLVTAILIEHATRPLPVRVHVHLDHMRASSGCPKLSAAVKACVQASQSSAT